MTNDYNYGPLEHELTGGSFAESADEHEQPAREGEEWVYNYIHEHAARHGGWHIRIRNDNGDCLAHALNERTAATIVYDHRLAALVPRLEAALRELLDCETNLAGCSGIKLLDAVDTARAVLNTVAKEREG